MENPNDPLTNQIRILLACSTVPQPTVPTHIEPYMYINIKQINKTEGSSKEMVVELYVSIPMCTWRESRKAQQYISQNIQFLG